MSKINENIVRIGKSIQRQSDIEKRNRGQQVAIARYDVQMDGPLSHISHLWLASEAYKPQRVSQFDITGGFRGTTGNVVTNDKEPNSRYFSKNSRLGTILQTKSFGSYTYPAPKDQFGKKMVERKVTFTSRATYNSGYSVRNLNIQIQGEGSFHFGTLDDLLNKVNKAERELETKRREILERKKEEERIKQAQEAKEAELRRAAAEEAERLRKEQEELAAQQALMEKQRKEEEEAVRALEEKKRLAIEQIEQTQNEYRSGKELRYQEVVDEFQTRAKISHLYDGVPIVIDGGPGTGKTTTAIARLKFLLDEHLIEHDCALTSAQIDKITDPLKLINNWIFISPSALLAQYLKGALSAEGLANQISNVIPYDVFLNNYLRDYEITFSPSGRKAPFKALRSDAQYYSTKCVLNGKELVDAFEGYMINQISTPFKKAASLELDGFEWATTAKKILAYARDVLNAKDLLGIVRNLRSLQESMQGEVKEFALLLKDKVDILAYRVQNNIIKDEEMFEYVKLLFSDWENTVAYNDNEEADSVEEEEVVLETDDVEQKLYDNVKGIIRVLALQKYDSSTALSKKRRELFELAESAFSDLPLEEISDLVWFNKNFASLCKGEEALVLRQLLKFYKAFRRDAVKSGSPLYDVELLKTLISSSNNRTLHRDEQSFLLGFINKLMLRLRQWSVFRFDSYKQAFPIAYKGAVKYVICVDEASDYSELDYYCISSFAHYEFSAITLCGDIMQGLNGNGLLSWDKLREWVFPNLDVFTLKRSYRQWPRLLDVSRQMYKDDQHKEAPFESVLLRLKKEFAPLAYVSKNDDQKIDWLANRIFEICRNNRPIPSIAIFVNEDEDVKGFISKLQEHDAVEPFIFDDCTQGKDGREDSIRIYYLSTVKGMEFEAALFHNIDKAKFENDELLRRYLYVGISRAVSHLGATFSSDQSDVLKYFERNKTWKL